MMPDVYNFLLNRVKDLALKTVMDNSRFIFLEKWEANRKNTESSENAEKIRQTGEWQNVFEMKTDIKAGKLIKRMHQRKKETWRGRIIKKGDIVS